MHLGVKDSHARLIHCELIKLEERIQKEVTRQDKVIEEHLTRIYKCLGFKKNKDKLVKLPEAKNQVITTVAPS